MKKQDNYLAMPVIHQQVAGIGSQFHIVAVGDDPKQHVQQFGVSTKELFRLADWLRQRQVKHVAMEATGGYEKPLVSVLQEAGFEVLVTSGANTKNYRRFKSDTAPSARLRCYSHPYPAQPGTVTAYLYYQTNFRCLSGS